MASNSLQVGASDYRNRTKAIGPFDGNNNNDGDMMDRLNICDTSSADARAGDRRRGGARRGRGSAGPAQAPPQGRRGGRGRR